MLDSRWIHHGHCACSDRVDLATAKQGPHANISAPLPDDDVGWSVDDGILSIVLRMGGALERTELRLYYDSMAPDSRILDSVFGAIREDMEN